MRQSLEEYVEGRLQLGNIGLIAICIGLFVFVVYPVVSDVIENWVVYLGIVLVLALFCLIVILIKRRHDDIVIAKDQVTDTTSCQRFRNIGTHTTDTKHCNCSVCKLFHSSVTKHHPGAGKQFVIHLNTPFGRRIHLYYTPKQTACKPTALPFSKVLLSLANTADLCYTAGKESFGGIILWRSK